MHARELDEMLSSTDALIGMVARVGIWRVSATYSHEHL